MAGQDLEAAAAAVVVEGEVQVEEVPEVGLEGSGLLMMFEVVSFPCSFVHDADG
jgi:hypothetical protein